MRWGRPTISMSPGDKTTLVQKWSRSVVSNSLRPHGLNSLPVSSVHGVFQAKILGWVAISFSSRSSWLRDWTWVSCIIGRYFTIWATGEVTLVQSVVLLPAFLWSWSVYLNLPRLIVLIFKEELIETIAKINEMVHHERLDMYMARRKHSVIARNRKNGCQSIGSCLWLQVTRFQVLNFESWVNWQVFSHHIWIIWISTVLHPNNSIQVID